jgi:hypothetical protein
MDEKEVAEYWDSNAESSATPPFQTPVFHRTMSDWLNLLIDTGFVIERLQEPRASAEAVATWPLLADTNIVAYFLLVRCRKPALDECLSQSDLLPTWGSTTHAKPSQSAGE